MCVNSLCTIALRNGKPCFTCITCKRNICTYVLQLYMWDSFLVLFVYIYIGFVFVFVVLALQVCPKYFHCFVFILISFVAVVVVVVVVVYQVNCMREEKLNCKFIQLSLRMFIWMYQLRKNVTVINKSVAIVYKDYKATTYLYIL